MRGALVSTSIGVYRLLLNAVRPPCLSCDASTSAECFEPSRPQLCPGLRVLAAGCREHVWAREGSSQAYRLLELRTIVFWTLRF